MNNKEVVFLKKVPLFEGLSEEELKFVFEKMKRLKLESGKTLFKEGDAGDEMFIIYKGEVEVSQSLTLKLGKSDFGARDKILSTLSDKDFAFFGEMALLENSERTATVITRTPAEFLVIERKVWEEIKIQNKDIGYKILNNIVKVLCARLRYANQNVLKLTTALSIALSK